MKNIRSIKSVNYRYLTNSFKFGKPKDGHAVVSTFDLFSIGIGPSSSHTVGPMRASKMFIDDLVKHNLIEKVNTLKIDIYGSLSLTGEGHGTPPAILMGLEGETPEEIETSKIEGKLKAIKDRLKIRISDEKVIDFDVNRDMKLHPHSLPFHPNGLRYSVFDLEGDVVATNEYYSIGGGFVLNDTTIMKHENVYYHKSTQLERQSRLQELTSQSHVVANLPFYNAKELLNICSRRKMTISQVVYENEKRWRSHDEIINSISKLWHTMDDSITNGIQSNEKYLPGKLNVRRRAPKLYETLIKGQSALLTPPKSPVNITDDKLQEFLRPSVRRIKHLLTPTIDFLSVYSIAVNEENASGGRVVTAPTNGAAGVIPSVLKYYLQFVDYTHKEKDVMTFLFTAAAIGMLFKKAASISASEMGCQGEVGVACSMAAAAFTAVMGGSPEMIENAAEIGIEHNLGLTCDPIGGLVQIPCIERNAMGAVKAVTAAQLALKGDGVHRVHLDQAINTMRETGIDMKSKYKETSQGGLAVNVPIC